MVTSLELLEQSKRRAEAAAARRTQVQVRLESAREQYAEAVKDAEAAHGTSNLNKLREILAAQEAANAKAVTEFVQAVDNFEAFIASIERALASPEAMNALLESLPAVEPEAAPVGSSAPAVAPAVDFDEADI